MADDTVDAIVVGVDGFDPQYLKRYLLEGKLPNIAGYVDEGTMRLREIDVYYSDNLDQPKTSQAWPSIYCGGGADHHGITTPQWAKGGVDFDADVPSTIFDDVSQAGLTADSYRMAMTWPARDINGWMLSGFPSGTSEGVEAAECWGIDPDALPDDYAEVQDHYIYSNSGEITEFVKAEERKFEICTELLEATGYPNVLFYGTQLPDKAGHVVTEFGEEMERATDDQYGFVRAYMRMDDLFGWLIEQYDPSLLVAISDHGFQQHFGGHSDRSVLVEYTDGEVSSRVEDVDSVLDLRDYLTTQLGIEAVGKYNLYNGEQDEVDEITEEERSQAVDRLDDLGYL